ncbi:MAG: hypothetical protein R6U17_09815, partial [Thermoplasmata archaeon]
ESKGLLDVSFLANYQQEGQEHKKAGCLSVAVSNTDADDLMEIWLHADKKGKDTFDVSPIKMSNKKLLRLKSRGLLSGGTDQVKITPKGRTVVSTMALGENNKFLKRKQENNYGLGRRVSTLPKALASSEELYGKNLSKRQKMLLKDKIDVTSWMVALSEELL